MGSPQARKLNAMASAQVEQDGEPSSPQVEHDAVVVVLVVVLVLVAMLAQAISTPSTSGQWIVDCVWRCRCARHRAPEDRSRRRGFFEMDL